MWPQLDTIWHSHAGAATHSTQAGMINIAIARSHAMQVNTRLMYWKNPSHREPPRPNTVLTAPTYCRVEVREHLSAVQRGSSLIAARARERAETAGRTAMQASKRWAACNGCHRCHARRACGVQQSEMHPVRVASKLTKSAPLNTHRALALAADHQGVHEQRRCVLRQLNHH